MWGGEGRGGERGEGEGREGESGEGRGESGRERELRIRDALTASCRAMDKESFFPISSNEWLNMPCPTSCTSEAANVTSRSRVPIVIPLLVSVAVINLRAVWNTPREWANRVWVAPGNTNSENPSCLMRRRRWKGRVRTTCHKACSKGSESNSIKSWRGSRTRCGLVEGGMGVSADQCGQWAVKLRCGHRSDLATRYKIPLCGSW